MYIPSEIRSRVERLLKKLKQSKYKLYDKTIKIDTFDITWLRFIDEFGDLNFTISITNLIVKLLDLKFKFDFFSKFGYQKAIYGKSKYGLSIVDPEDWRKAVNLLINYAYTKSLRHTTGHHILSSMDKVIGIYSSYFLDAGTRAQIFIKLILEYTFCGFSICGYSKMSPTRQEIEERHIQVEINTPLLTRVKSKFRYFVDAHFGTIVGITPCGFARAFSINNELNKQFLKEVDYHDFVNEVKKSVYDQLSRFEINITGSKLIEGGTKFDSVKIEKYYNKMAIVVLIENIVKNMLSRYKFDIMSIQNYVNFAKELVLGRVKKHDMFKKGFQYISDQDYINYLIEKYTKMGLNKTILENIAKTLIRIAKHYWYNYKLY